MITNNFDKDIKSKNVQIVTLEKQREELEDKFIKQVVIFVNNWSDHIVNDAIEKYPDQINSLSKDEVTYLKQAINDIKDSFQDYIPQQFSKDGTFLSQDYADIIKTAIGKIGGYYSKIN